MAKTQPPEAPTAPDSPVRVRALVACTGGNPPVFREPGEVFDWDPINGPIPKHVERVDEDEQTGPPDVPENLVQLPGARPVYIQTDPTEDALADRARARAAAAATKGSTAASGQSGAGDRSVLG